MTTAQPQKEGYSIIDRRGTEPCRVCTCPNACHSQEYGKPTMDCIMYLRHRVGELEGELQAFRILDAAGRIDRS